MKERKPAEPPRTETTTSSHSSESASPAEDLRARIVKRAYELYEERGREDGHDLDDWLEAEREVASG